ncbi:MAG: extracellular solute-binding protein [Candidatus Omnitrophota bacterium]
MGFTRIFFIIIAAVLVSFLIFGCGSGKKTDELVMWLVGSESQARMIMKLGEQFTEETGVKVYCQAISWGNAHSKYLTSIAGGVSPDIGTMGLTWGMEFGELGAMVDLNKEFPEDTAELGKKMFSSMLKSTRIGESIYGIPFDLSEHVMYYRNDIIASPPKTWEELLETLSELKARDKGMLIDWGSLEWIGFAPFLWQAGGRFYNDDYTKVDINTPEAAEALDFMKKLYMSGVPKTKVPLEQGLRTGDYPLAISGNWKIISLTVGAPEIKGKWDIAMLPAGPSGRRTAFIGGRVLGIFSESKMKKEAWEFIKFLFRPEVQQELYKDSLETEESYLPPNIDSWKKLNMNDKFKNVLENQAKDAKGPPPVMAWDSSTRFINQAIQMVVLKNADPAEELKKASLEMQKELDARNKK